MAFCAERVPAVPPGERLAATTSARPGRRRRRSWRSRSPTGSPTSSSGCRAAWTSNAFAPGLSFFFNAHIDFFEEIAKFRAARRIWARWLRDRYGATDPDAMRLRFHTQTAGVSLTAQQPMNNVVRTAIEALAAVLGRHAVAPHERARRGAGAAHRGRREARAAHPADHRVRDRAWPTSPIRSAARTSWSRMTDRIEERRRGGSSPRSSAMGEGSMLEGVLAGIERGGSSRQIADSAFRRAAALRVRRPDQGGRERVRRPTRDRRSTPS